VAQAGKLGYKGLGEILERGYTSGLPSWLMACAIGDACMTSKPWAREEKERLRGLLRAI